MSNERKDVTITVRMDRSLKTKMDERPEINWSGVARKAIRGTIEDLEVMDEIAAKNRMTEADAKEIADRITKSANERARTAREEAAVENRADGGTMSDRSAEEEAFESERSLSDEAETAEDTDTSLSTDTGE